MPESKSVALSFIIFVPLTAFSNTRTLYSDLLKIGALSFASFTFTFTVSVPDLGGLPPSTAVRRSLITGCVSRSKAFCSTNSADTPCSPPEKYSFGVNLNALTVFLREYWIVVINI
uniref:Uncharacterized protein n=1 Tax=Echeneis naucrates TaxID=173247 RepID=A0A665UKT5_ECHNA